MYSVCLSCMWIIDVQCIFQLSATKTQKKDKYITLIWIFYFDNAIYGIKSELFERRRMSYFKKSATDNNVSLWTSLRKFQLIKSFFGADVKLMRWLSNISEGIYDYSYDFPYLKHVLGWTVSI